MFVFMQSPASKNSEIIQKDIDFWAQFQPRISSFTCIRAFHMHSRWTMCDSALTCRLVYLNDCDHFSFYHRSISFMTDCTPCSVRQHHVPYSQKDHRPPSVTPSSWIKKKMKNPAHYSHVCCYGPLPLLGHHTLMIATGGDGDPLFY